MLPTAPEVALCEKGEDLLLTMDNLGSYLSLVQESLFNKAYRPCVSAFAGQLKKVIRVEHLSYFRREEVNQLFCGEVDYSYEFSLDSLPLYVLPMHGYSRDSPQYTNFLTILVEMPSHMKGLFFKFLTGCPRLPQGGLKSLCPLLTLVKKIPLQRERVDDILPSVMT